MKKKKEEETVASSIFDHLECDPFISFSTDTENNRPSGKLCEVDSKYLEDNHCNEFMVSKLNKFSPKDSNRDMDQFLQVLFTEMSQYKYD